MKLFAVFLSIFVLLLTTVPCCALEKSQVHHQEEKQDNCSENEQDCCKCCSPFYVCGTCVGFTINSHSVITFAIYLKPILYGSIYRPMELKQTPSVIWQPPKLS